MKKKNEHTQIGLDAIEINITGVDTNIKQTEIYHSRRNNKIGELKKAKEGYVLTLTLPKMLRGSNIAPFGLYDAIRLEETIEEIKIQLEELFQIDFDNEDNEDNENDITVKSVEVNCTAMLKKPENVGAIMNLFARMFLEDDNKVFLTVHGVNDSKYENVPLSANILRKVPQVESLRTCRCSNGRFSLKLYNKGLEQVEKGFEQADKGLLRIEEKVNSKGIAFLGIPSNLCHFLTKQNIEKLINGFKRDFREQVLDVYWYRGEKTFADALINTMVFDLKENTPLVTAKIHRDILYIDFELFERACLHFYSNKKTAQKTIYRIKNNKTIMHRKGAISEFVQISRAIVY